MASQQSGSRVAGSNAAGSVDLRTNLTLWACSALHVVNDAFFAVMFPLLPLLAADLDLSYAEVGLIKTAFSGASSAFQLPVGLLAERWGEYALLVGGNAWVAAGLIGMGLAGSYLPLLALTVLGGLGGNTQHPLAAALVSRRAPPQRRATAVGTLNFAGDLGKIVGPPLVALVALPFGWRTALITLGAFGLLFSLAIARLPIGRVGEAPGSPRQPATPHRRVSQSPSGIRVPESARRRLHAWGLDQPRRFALLTALGFVDSSTRGAALAFLPFLMADKGLDPAQVSWLFTVVFVGGAFGKYGCGSLGDRFGATTLIISTELVTVGALALFPAAPVVLVPLLALCFGFVLNGTSSVLYAMVAELVPEERRSRGYGLYYTLITGASALAPVLYGLLGDRAGLAAIFAAMAAVNAITLPLGLALGRGAPQKRTP
jgi:FSR family fosmidomycin resistance protein-like MFS transporter